MKLINKSATVLAVLVLLLGCLSTSVVRANNSVELAMKSTEVEYTLPYTGILPDNPLYIFKVMRDGCWLFLTRDNNKKAELLLLFADKRVAMAQELGKKGKWSLALETLKASQDDVDRLIHTAGLAQRLGTAPTDDFLDTAILSNEKHLEVMENMFKSAPDEARNQLEEIMDRNTDQYNELDKL